jgi:outer membrane protein assembly factor BamB
MKTFTPIIAVLFVAVSTPNAADPKKDGQDATGEDVLAEVLQAQSSKYASPPSNFRSGHVSPHPVAPNALTATSNGFRFGFPSHAPITTPAVHKGLVLSSGGFHSKELYAFDARNGKVAWALDLDDDGPSALACEDGVCAFNTESCTLFVVAAKTGKMVWSKWLGDPLTSAPAISKGIVYASYPVAQVSDKHPRPPNMSHAIAAFELNTGKVLWQRWIDSDVMSSPVVSGDELWLTTFAGTVYKMNSSTGNILSARRARATSAPVVRGNEVLFSFRSEKGKGVEEAITSADKSLAQGWMMAGKRADYLDAEKQSVSGYATLGKMQDASNGFAGGAPQAAAPLKAEANIGQSSVSTMQAFQGSRVLPLTDKNISAMGDEVVCADSRTGRRVWAVKLEGDLAKAGGFLAAPPVAAGKYLIVGTLSREVLQLNPDTGAVMKRWKVGGAIRSQPVVQDGWIYVGTDDGQLIAIDTHDASLTGWTQWGANAARTGKL